MKDAPDFEAINQAGLAAFPAVLGRLLPRGKTVGRRLSPSTRAGRIALSDRSKSTDLTADGVISRLATGAAIPFRWSPIWPTFPKPKRRACSPKCSGSKPAGGTMDSPLDAFAPLTEAKLVDAARHVPQDLVGADMSKPTCPPSDAENGVLAAARLYGRKPDSSWRHETTEGETAFYTARWNERGQKNLSPGIVARGCRLATDGLARQSAAIQLTRHQRTTKLGDCRL